MRALTASFGVWHRSRCVCEMGSGLVFQVNMALIDGRRRKNLNGGYKLIADDADHPQSTHRGYCEDVGIDVGCGFRGNGKRDGGTSHSHTTKG